MLECCGSSAELSFGSLLQNCSSRSRRVSRLAGLLQIMTCGSRAEPNFASLFQNRSSRSRRVSELAGCLQFLACAPTVQGPRCASASEQNVCYFFTPVCFSAVSVWSGTSDTCLFYWTEGAENHTGIKENLLFRWLAVWFLVTCFFGWGPAGSQRPAKS